ncbi:MAG: IPTL-CTERM sorting domain-containing protein [Betaproteobacteria bacterium]
MTQARLHVPNFADRHASSRGVAAVVFRALAATLFALVATAALGQTIFRTTIEFDQTPASYAARDPITASIFMFSDTGDATNISFTSVLPAGSKFVSAPASNQCGGTVTSTANSFSLANGAFPADVGCRVTVRIFGEPQVDTTYTFSSGTISFTSGRFNGTDSATGDFDVAAGIPPTFTDSIPADGRVGESYAYFVGVDGTAPIVINVSGLPPGLSFDAPSSTIQGTPTKPGTYMVPITAKNGFLPDANATYTITVLGPLLSAAKAFSPGSVITGDTTQMRITLTNSAPVSLVSFSDPFPAGLGAAPATSAQCGGTVTVTANSLAYFGNLPKPGSCTITVPVVGTSVSDRTIVNTTSNISFNDGSSLAGVSGSLFVRAGSPPTITSGQPPDGAVGSNYLHVISVVGTPQVQVSVSGLPPGLSFDGGMRAIIGTPTRAGTFSGTITAHNAFAPDDTQAFTIVIRNPPLAIVTSTLPPIGGGDAVHVPIVAQGGIPPYTFELLSGQLPPGLNFDATGFLTGVATLPGVYAFTVQVTDSVGTKATKSYTITIDKGVPLFTFTITPNPAVAGQAVVATATLSGGAGAAGGDVQVWVAHSDERCPQVAGPAPVAAKTVTSALGATSEVKFTFADLGIDHYQVCATYAGDVRYKSVSAGPFDVFVIKGALLPSPTVAIAAPLAVKANEIVTARVVVTAPATSAIAPSGSVLLRADGQVVGTVALVGGAATFSTTAPGVPGSVTLTASYLGDGAFPPAVSAPAIVAVTKAGAVAANPIPTLSNVALALLMSMLAAIGALLHRRRRG